MYRMLWRLFVIIIKELSMTIYIVEYNGEFDVAFTNLEAARKYVAKVYTPDDTAVEIYPYVVRTQ